MRKKALRKDFYMEYERASEDFSPFFSLLP